ncbi:MarC family protein [Mangrovicoccus sp. HB161399]|uniref:MarC family protein n=1 Tax=Mangrovicoccus sp. HB161399 TaxID=2720392 RepID=UPI0015528708|nr:MarC family protein [Mangrovicoccus sp. HB161399]
MDHISAIKFFGALFAIMNPFVNLPVFLGLTDGFTKSLRRSVALRLGLYSAVMCAATALAGSPILRLFGISVDDFRVAGGLVLLLIALNMLHGEESSTHHGSEDEQDGFARAKELAFYPLTFPIIVGPGTITTLIVFSGQVKTPLDIALYAGVLAAVLALLCTVLLFAGPLGALLGQTARAIMSRLMGMILAAIAVSMIAAGLRSLLPGLAGAAS